MLYDAQATIEIALNNYWKIKAIDSLGGSGEIPAEEQKKLFDSLIHDKEIKDILAK